MKRGRKGVRGGEGEREILGNFEKLESNLKEREIGKILLS